jgi:hypothetical protein
MNINIPRWYLVPGININTVWILSITRIYYTCTARTGTAHDTTIYECKIYIRIVRHNIIITYNINRALLIYITHHIIH